MPLKVRVYAKTTVYQSKVEETLTIEDSELEGLTKEQIDVLVEELAREYIDMHLIETGWSVESE